MKRSTMIKILKASFNYHLSNAEPSQSENEIYSNILTDLESAGMMPPESLLFHGSDEFTCQWQEEASESSEDGS